MTRGWIELDIGNSRVKWRVQLANDAAESGYFSHEEFVQTAVSEFGRFEHLQGLRVSCVADSLRPVVTVLGKALNLDVQFAQTTATCAGVTNSYQQPSTMGVDRWLAMLAAFNSSQHEREADNVCVIDCGTSLTIDHIDGAGQHKGGLILPGRRLLLSSLQQNTEKVLFNPTSQAGELVLGQNTEQAVLNGALHMMVGAIYESIESSASSPDSQYFLTGGDADWLAAKLKLKTLLVPDLVLDGLQYSLP